MTAVPVERHQARILAMQALCQWEAQADESPDALEEFFADEEASRRAARQAGKLVRAFWARRRRIDKLIASATEQWAFSRISMVERNIMRVAVVEMIERTAPPKVALNEAIEIGREFGGADSPRFINGVLDRVFERISKDGS